jgi:hypothetical protein
VIPLDPVGTIVILVSVDEPLALARVVELAPLLTVDKPLAPVIPVVAGEPTSPVVVENSVEPVPVVTTLERVVVCVTPVVPGISQRKTFISKRRLYY